MADNRPPPQSDEGWPRPPYAWIITPLLIFVLIAIAATLLQLRRRTATRRFAAAHAQRVDGDTQQQQSPGGPDLEAGRGTRTRRWGTLRRREEPVEGLDENGEAPPPYEPAGAKKEDVELRDVAGSPPDYAENGRHASAVQAPPAAIIHER